MFSEVTLGEWLFIATIPVITLLFGHAFISTLRTHGWRLHFDSGVLLWCMVINVIACLLEVWCTHTVALLNQVLQAAMMVYILFRVSGLREE